jgi:hypothetical protein
VREGLSGAGATGTTVGNDIDVCATAEHPADGSTMAITTLTIDLTNSLVIPATPKV